VHYSSMIALPVILLIGAQPPSADAPRNGSPHVQHGMRLPRPVDPVERESRGFSLPRNADIILAEIDAAPDRMRAAPDDPAGWRAVRLNNEAVKRDRIDLISELEESGYAGPRLNDLLRQKLQDIRAVWSRAQFPADSFDGLRRDMMIRYRNTDLAIEAEADALLELVHITTLGGLRIHPADYQRLADLELRRKNSELGGLLLLEALHADKDAELRRTWHEWMVQNLGPEAMGRRYVIRQRSFGQPIQLEGEGLDGSKIDTAAWAGDVILVDFWGTWCVPCKEAMPELQRLQDRYEGKGLRIVGVLCDHELGKASRWLREKGYAWPHIVDRSLTPQTYDKHRIAVQYAVGGFPTLWIIDRRGILREEGDRENLEEQLRRYLEEPPAVVPTK